MGVGYGHASNLGTSKNHVNWVDGEVNLSCRRLSPKNPNHNLLSYASATAILIYHTPSLLSFRNTPNASVGSNFLKIPKPQTPKNNSKSQPWGC